MCARSHACLGQTRATSPQISDVDVCSRTLTPVTLATQLAHKDGNRLGRSLEVRGTQPRCFGGDPLSRQEGSFGCAGCLILRTTSRRTYHSIHVTDAISTHNIRPRLSNLCPVQRVDHPAILVIPPLFVRQLLAFLRYSDSKR